MKARILVYPRPEILDPQGKAIESALARVGFEGVSSVRAGKSFDLEIEAADEVEAEKKLQEMCQKLLANTVVEDYEIALVGAAEAPAPEDQGP